MSIQSAYSRKISINVLSYYSIDIKKNREVYTGIPICEALRVEI